MTPILTRQAFETSRELEFFTEKELNLQIGVRKGLWPLALLKELIDNSLDACEGIGVNPEFEVIVTADSMTVADNGPGLSKDVLVRSLDYSTRISSNAAYVSPSRGQLGNALKCLWAAGFVADGQQGLVNIATQGELHIIEVQLDHIAQKPVLNLTSEPGTVNSGTQITLFWPELAWSLSECDSPENPDFYRAHNLLQKYAAFNPHARFSLSRPERDPFIVAPTATLWRKWITSEPTSPHWYSEERLRDLIARHINHGDNLTVRDFVSHFRGLSGTAKRKAVTEAANLSGALLQHMVIENNIDPAKVKALLEAMRHHAKLVKPEQLGVIGSEHFEKWFSNCRAGSFKYQCIKEIDAQGLPYVLELGFGIHEDESLRKLVAGINFTPLLNNPFPELDSMLSDCRIDGVDPVSLIIHLACPQVIFTDRGKGRVSLPPDVLEAMGKALEVATKQWQKIKRKADRDGKARERAIEAGIKAESRRCLSIKDAAYEVMEKAYEIASSNGTLPANARQIMYAGRPLILELTGQTSLKDVYFTQGLLPDFIIDNPKLTEKWDVVFDDRGHFHEPHTGVSLGLGTLAVRRYMEGWKNPSVTPARDPVLLDKEVVKTNGAQGRYRFALFIEKEGFMPLFQRAKLAERYDIAIMSSKGMSTTATRRLIEALAEQDVTILVAHDFDKAGITILHTLQNDTRRYQFKTRPLMIDLGLRLDDIRSMDLQSEPVTYESGVNPQVLLIEQGATLEEAQFLVQGGRTKNWRGERVELNAMTAAVMLDWLERKFAEYGVTKVMPDREILEAAYRRSRVLGRAEDLLDRQIELCADIAVPPDLLERVKAQLTGTQSWDKIVVQLAAEAAWPACQ